MGIYNILSSFSIFQIQIIYYIFDIKYFMLRNNYVLSRIYYTIQKRKKQLEYTKVKYR